jgi:hypothetical protein
VKTAVYLGAGLLALVAVPLTLFGLWLSSFALADLLAQISGGTRGATITALVIGLVLGIAAVLVAVKAPILVAVILWGAILSPGLWQFVATHDLAGDTSARIAWLVAGALIAAPVVLVVRGSLKGRRWS